VHLQEDIICFGPLLGVATEKYEAFNAIFHFCSVLSNHLVPSCDIANQLAKQEVLRHIISGGYWVEDMIRLIFKQLVRFSVHVHQYATNFLCQEQYVLNP
jgi:hypothetical protein